MIFLKKVSLVLLICAYCFGCTNNKQSESRVADSVATDTIQDANGGTIDSKEETIQVNTNICVTQNENLRFVAGHPNTDYDFDYDPEYVNVSGILKIVDDSLVEETALSDSTHILFYIRQYPEYDKLFAFSCERDKKFHQQLSATAASKLYVVDTKTLEKKVFDIPFSLKENEVEYEVAPTGTQFVLLDSTLFMCFECMNYELPKGGEKKRLVYYSLNTVNGKFEKVEPEIYRNVIVNNERLLFRRVSDGMVMKGDTVLNALRIATPEYYGNPIFTDNLPPGIKVNPKTAAWAGGGLILNTKEIMVLYFYEEEKGEDMINMRKLHVLDKMSGEWSSFSINSNRVLIEYHNGYILGHLRVDTNKGLLPFNSAYWTKPMTKYGPYYAPGWNYKSEWQQLAPYSEGCLFIYHVDTQSMIQWNTGHGDSEILMLKDECVYYRVYDKIYKASIINHKALGEPELIIQNTLIGDVHWMFQIGN